MRGFDFITTVKIINFFQFWEVIFDEHGIDSSHKYTGNSDQQLEKINVYFKETGDGYYTPRAILVDLEPGTLDVIKARTYGDYFTPDNYVFGEYLL